MGQRWDWAAGSAGLGEGLVGEEKERWAATEMGDGLDTEKRRRIGVGVGVLLNEKRGKVY
jgi:hypothetical protein